MPEESGEVTAETLLAAAQEYDASVEAGEQPVVEFTTTEPEPEKEETPPEEPTEAAKAEPDAEGQDVDEPESSLTVGKTPEEEVKSQKSESKWAKNEVRKNKAWKAINAGKEENKRVREELEGMKAQLLEEQSDMDEGKAYRDEKGFTAEDYEDAAVRLREEGEERLAKDAEVKAESVVKDGQLAVQKRYDAKAQGDYEKSRQDLMREMPDLRDNNSELTKAANVVLGENPGLINGDGLRNAVRMAQWKIAADQTGKSQAEVKELTDKINKLEKKMSVGGGFTSEKLDGEQTFDDLSLDDQESYLLKAAAAHDDAI